MKKEILDELIYEAGYPGEDSMRSKAERLFREEAGGLPQSASAPSRTPMRLYKRGGHVKHHDTRHETKHRMGHDIKKGLERGKLHDMQEHELRAALRAIKAERKMANGGHMRKGMPESYVKHEGEMMPQIRPEGYKKGGHHKGKHLPRAKETVMGGSLTDLYIPRRMSGRTPPLSIQSSKEMAMMKKGGHAKKSQNPFNQENHRTLYEREMLGMHPSHKRPHINYENDMRGEICESHPSNRRMKNPGAVDESGGQFKRKGGRVHRYAAGGAAKVRHGVANRHGVPITRRVDRSK